MIEFGLKLQNKICSDDGFCQKVLSIYSLKLSTKSAVLSKKKFIGFGRKIQYKICNGEDVFVTVCRKIQYKICNGEDVGRKI